MTNPVAPKEGHYALLRNNEVTRPRPDQWANKAAFFDGLHHWWQDGTSVENCDAFDIIATISPADMQAAASGELERLRAENENLRVDRGFAIGWIKGLANNPHKPMTWMQTREAAADFVAALEGSQ